MIYRVFVGEQTIGYFSDFKLAQSIAKDTSAEIVNVSVVQSVDEWQSIQKQEVYARALAKLTVEERQVLGV